MNRYVLMAYPDITNFDYSHKDMSVEAEARRGRLFVGPDLFFWHPSRACWTQLTEYVNRDLIMYKSKLVLRLLIQRVKKENNRLFSFTDQYNYFCLDADKFFEISYKNLYSKRD